MKIQLDMYQTLAVAVLVLLLGNYLKRNIFPSEILYSGACHRRTDFAIMTCICYVTGIAEFPLMTHCARSAWYSSLHL